jgi:hypothetical protein
LAIGPDIGQNDPVDSRARESLERRLARLRLQVARTLRDARDATSRARVVTDQTSESRRLRWTVRYERTLERKTRELGDLKP